MGTGLDFTPALEQAHISTELVVAPGSGLDLAAPLKFNHAANLPFADRGTGISFKPATAFAHSSNEPVQPLGTGIALDRPLATSHAIKAVVSDSAASNAGYEGTTAPNQWFGGPVFTSVSASSFTPTPPTLTAGSMVLRDAAGLVVDSLNYALSSIRGQRGLSGRVWSGAEWLLRASAGRSQILRAPNHHFRRHQSKCRRFPDGNDTDSNCNDSSRSPPPNLLAASAAGATNIKVGSVADFAAAKLSRWIPAQAARRLSSQRWARRRNRICNSHHCRRHRHPCRRPHGLQSRPGHRNRHRRES